MTMFTHFSFLYLCKMYTLDPYTIFFPLIPTLKLCNFITVRVEKNLVGTIFVENFMQNIFVLMIFFLKSVVFEKKAKY